LDTDTFWKIQGQDLAILAKSRPIHNFFVDTETDTNKGIFLENKKFSNIIDVRDKCWADKGKEQ
jgi:hypothetical protein